jgi:hypothetical protein
MWKKYLQRIALIAIAIFGVKTGIENFKSSAADRSNDAVVIAAWNERLSKLTAPIPFERGFIGYLSNADIPGAAFSSDDAEGEFVLTQYSIAPLILVRGTGQAWNILNLDDEIFKKWLVENANEFEVIRSGGGMYLVHKVTE